MRIGLFGWITRGGGGLDEALERFRQAEADGFVSCWAANTFSHEALTLLALGARVTSRIELGTAVVPTYPRHPTNLAQQALTVQEASGNRLILGIGLSHKIVIETMFGLDYSKPVRHMREYLSVLNPLLEGQPVAFQGEEFRVQARFDMPGVRKPLVLVAALGPQMLKLAGRMADGTITWMGGPKYLATQAVPLLTKAAADAGRPAPRVAAGFPIAVTSKADEAKAAAARTFAMYANLPSYRAVLDVEGSADPTGACIIGDESSVARQIKHLEDVGVTDLAGAPFAVPEDEGALDRTYWVLAQLGRAGTRPWEGL